MRAIVMRAEGGPEVLEERRLAVPAPGPGEILVRVRATSVNPLDYKLRAGMARVKAQPPVVLGHDVAGEVVQAGHAARDFQPGERVFYSPPALSGPGTYAEYHVIDEKLAAPMPASLAFEEAAALPLAGCTAWQALFDRAGLAVGETALIHAGAGGVGSLAIQLARAAGARVLTTCRPENRDLTGKLGAEQAIDYRSEDFVQAALEATAGRGVDVVLDTVGRDTLARSTGCAAPQARLVSITNTTGNLLPGYLRNVTIHLLFMQRSRATLGKLKNLVERELLRPVIDSVLPLAEVARAHEKLEAGGVRGKIVIMVD